MSAANLSLTPEEPQEQSSKALLYSVLLALLIHFFVFFYRLEWGRVIQPSRVEIQKVDPQKLEALRKRWHEQSLLLNKSKSADTKTAAPKDAKYYSDRNIRVEKEQRAARTQVIPKEGFAAGMDPDRGVMEEQTKKGERKISPHQLGNLGIPMNLTSTPPSDHLGNEDQPLPSKAGGDQAIADQSLPVGSENMLNAQESVYYSYYSRLYESVGPLWQSRIRSVPLQKKVPPGEYTTVVDVIFDQAGYLIGVKRLQSAGIEEFDRVAEESWKKIGRFPNPPTGLLNAQREVHTGWTFTVRVEEGFRLQYLPPERNY